MARREPWERMSRHREISWLSSLAQGASPHSHFQHPLSVSITSMLKPMNTRKNSFSHSFSTSTSRFMKKGRLTRAGGYFRFIFMIHNLQKLVHMQRSTSCCIWWCQKDRIITIQQLTLVLGRRAKRGGPFPTHRPHPTANPTISFASVPRQRWVLNRGKQMAAPLSSKRGTGESWASS